MKRILSIILVMITIVLPSLAQEQNGNSQPIKLEIQQQAGSTIVLRAPMRIDIDAFYDAERHVLDIYYYGESDGEVFLYLNGNLIGHESEICSSFQVLNPGLYTVEIHAERWIAQGYLQL